MSASLSATIMEFLNNLFGDEEARAAFLADPEAVLDEHGLGDLSCADFDDAIVAFVENSGRDDVNLGGTFHNTVPEDGESDHEAIAKHLTEIVNNNTYITNEDNDVYNDQSFNGTVVADGDVTFDNDIVSASGDGAVAAGDDIEDSNIVTGDDNIIGNGNQVGDDSAFGAGSVAGGVTVDDGGAFATTGGTATGSQDDNSDNRVDNSDNSDNRVDNSDNSDNRVDNTDNSINTDVDVDDSFQANTDVDDSFQDNSETETDVNTESGPGNLSD
ncbi:MAG: IniB N-terminal domain-containing protein [Pseudonocardia sp.]|nr:IniB N-terminal domain-containing protein [Pseudonocardia sp.]